MNVDITLTTYLIVCPLVFLSGLIDAIAGGGGLISLPAYMIAGFPPITALATNKLSACMGTCTATIKFAKSGFVNMKTGAVCSVIALAGAAAGARLALMIDNHIFKILMLIILPVTAFYVMKGKAIDEKHQDCKQCWSWPILCVITLGIGIYDGFYGPGTGTFLILLLTNLAHMKLTEANGLTKVINLSTNAAAMFVYLVNGKTIVILGLVAGVFGIIGNYIGASMFEQGGAKFVKPAILIVLSLFFVSVLKDLIM
ncbi:MAG: TSUP family transporter [Eubacteriaceae bacterium]|jgi:uncharacterized membrane protein YfcA|nr:TSUP family transporter [Eubacteriaceae bacterium]